MSRKNLSLTRKAI